jgi:hypothetical protein
LTLGSNGYRLFAMAKAAQSEDGYEKLVEPTFEDVIIRNPLAFVAGGTL